MEIFNRDCSRTFFIGIITLAGGIGDVSVLVVELSRGIIANLLALLLIILALAGRENPQVIETIWQTCSCSREASRHLFFEKSVQWFEISRQLIVAAFY